ncbi:MAG: hypothetical protein AAB950_00515, partial [Patescibacteria group bacterium]
MENIRALKLLIVIVVGVILIAPIFSFAYEPETTHKALTQEIVKLFNYYSSNHISDVDRELIMQGSIDEDAGLRAVHHFYDPIHFNGLVLGGTEFLGAKYWGQDTLAQASSDVVFQQRMYGKLLSFFSSDTDFSWDRAVYEYAWGDKERGLKTLGHILHLIEDMAVPDHTRNDAHPPYADSVLHQSSPYEHWADKWNTENLNTTDVLIKEKKVPFYCNHLNSCFDSMALYSNQNFFSEDTILKSYNKPLILNIEDEVIDGTIFTFGFNKDQFGSRFRLIKIEEKIGKREKVYSLDAPKDIILQDYWSHLSKQAVLHGAGVAKLFFDEVAKEQQTRMLYEKNRSWVSRQADRAVAMVVNSVDATITAFYDSKNYLSARVDETATAFDNFKMYIFDSLFSNPNSNNFFQNNLALLSATLPNQTAPSFLADASALAPVIVSGGELNENPPENIPPVDVFRVLGVSTTTVASFAPQATSSLITATTTQLSSATTTASTTISVTATTTTASQPQTSIWGQGSSGSTIPVAEVPQTNGSSTPNASSSQEIIIDSTPPIVSLRVPECASSFSSTGCLLATTTITIQWSSDDTDVAGYQISCLKNGLSCADFPLATTSADMIGFSVEDNGLYQFSAFARDTAGNNSLIAEKTVEIRLLPAVINEVGWGGTVARDQDEYIELYNNSMLPINLDGFVLYSETDQKPFIRLTGVIPAKGYYLIERTDDTAISDVVANLTTQFGNGEGSGLANGGEILVLSFASTTVDKTARCGFLIWCGGNNTGFSMERINPRRAGADVENWKSHNALIKNGTDVNGGAVFGTPKARNSANYLVSPSQTVSADIVLAEDQSPYIITGDLMIPSGITLSAAEGTVIKFTGNHSLIIEGSLRFAGTIQKPVVITSFNDDGYGGDLNGNGTTTVPSRGEWNSIIFRPGSVGSIERSIIRYGGKVWSGTGHPQALLFAENASPTIKDSV